MDKTYRQWITAHQDRVWSLALYLLRDRAEAQDIAQDWSAGCIEFRRWTQAEHDFREIPIATRLEQLSHLHD